MSSKVVESKRKTHLKGSIRKCLFFDECRTIEVHDGLKWKIHWHNYNDKGLICRNHYNILVSNPRRTSEYHKKYNSRISPEQWKQYRSRVTKEQIKKWGVHRQPKRLQFKDRRIYLDKSPRTGYCSWCPNNIHDKSCRRTHIHHIQYYSIFVWFATIELCVSCHFKETWRLKRLG